MRQRLLLTMGFLALLGGFFGTARVAAAPVPQAYIAATDISQQPVNKQIVERTKASWPWYITRGSGLLAAVLLGALMVSGVGLLTGYTYKVLEPLAAWSMHRALGLALAASVAVHMLVLLFDKFAPFTIPQIFIPFVSHYRPVTLYGHNLGSFTVFLGIVGFYALIAIVVTSLVWIDKRPYTWRAFHYLAYLLLVAIFAHGLFLGTDLKGGTYRVLWIFGGLLVTGAIGLRLWRARTVSGDR